MIEVVNHTPLDGEALDVVRRVLLGLRTRLQVMAFARNQHPPLEFSRLLEHGDGHYDLIASRLSDSYVLAFTLGPDDHVTRATIWNRMPSDGELRHAHREAETTAA